MLYIPIKSIYSRYGSLYFPQRTYFEPTPPNVTTIVSSSILWLNLAGSYPSEVTSIDTIIPNRISISATYTFAIESYFNSYESFFDINNFTEALSIGSFFSFSTIQVTFIIEVLNTLVFCFCNSCTCFYYQYIFIL